MKKVQPLFNVFQAIISIIFLLIVLFILDQFFVLFIILIILLFYVTLTFAFRRTLNTISAMVNFTQSKQVEYVSAIQRGYKDLYVNNALFNALNKFRSNELTLRQCLIKVHLISKHLGTHWNYLFLL